MSEPIVMRHTRDTANYRVYEGGNTFEATDGRGQPVIKNTIQGGNGSIYVGLPVAKDIDAYVLVPKKLWDSLWTATGRIKTPPELQNTPAPKPKAKKGKK